MAGSIEKRGNSYRLVYSGGIGGDKKRIRYKKTIQAANLREAEKELAKFVAEIESGQFVAPSKQTFKEFSEFWLNKYGEQHLAAKTLARYKELLARINEAIGHIKLEKIKPLHIISFEDNLRQSGIRKDKREGALSEATILKYHRLLGSMLNDAMQWQIIASNPVSRVAPPRIQRPNVHAYDEEQISALLAALDHEPIKYRAMIELALATGIRRGELMGLEWSHINFNTGCMKVIQSAQYLPGKGTFIKETKTEQSDRIISLPDSTLALLKRYKKEQAEKRLKVGDKWRGSDRLFTTWDGMPMNPTSPTWWFFKFLKKHKLPHISFHAIRHTSATMLIGSGVNAKQVSSRLGHADIKTTLNIYTDALRSADKEAAAKMDELLDHARRRPAK